MIKISTSFEIYPTINRIPTFGEILDIANVKLKGFLNNINVFDDIKLSVLLHTKDGKLTSSSIIDKNFKLDENSYAWFYVEGIPGGTDAYFRVNDDLHIDSLNEEIKSNENMQKYSKKINKSFEVGYYWYFRRSVGQPGIISLSYGILAASLCMLTDGLIYTDDGAWDYSLFPTTAEDFFSWYFKPELSNNSDDKKWAEQCIKSIYEENAHKNDNN